MKKHVLKMTVLVIGGFLVLPLTTQALSGTNADDTRVKIYAEQGDDWFRAFTLRTDDHGVLEVKNMLPGWYKAKVNDDEKKSNQTVGLRARMLDLDGRRLKEDTNVDLYYDNNGTKTYISTVETDDKGWLEVSGLSADVEYKFEMSKGDNSHVGDEEGEVRIKCKAKIDESDWFSAYYDVTEDNILEVTNVLPGKYKFKYKKQDRDVTVPFNLSARLLNEKGEKIKEATKVHLWAYLGPEKTKVFAGEVWTNARGEVTIPGLMHGVKYKIEVFDN